MNDLVAQLSFDVLCFPLIPSTPRSIAGSDGGDGCHACVVYVSMMSVGMKTVAAQPTRCYI